MFFFCFYNNKLHDYQFHQYYVYIITNKENTTLYIGVTNNLQTRIWEHKIKYTRVSQLNIIVANWFTTKNFNGYKMPLIVKNN